MLEKIALWFLKNFKVAKKDVDSAMAKCDKDNDGFYSLEEIVRTIIEWSK